MKKYEEYANKIVEVMDGLFEEGHDNFIPEKELENEDNFRAFLHAIATVVPAKIYNVVNEEPKDELEFNHFANQLIFEYSKTK